MQVKDLETGTSVLLQIERGSACAYFASAIDSQIAGGVTVLSPLLGTTDFMLRGEDVIHLVYSELNQLIRWPCSVGKAALSGKVLVVDLICSGESRMYNRRDAFRIPMYKEIKYQVDQQAGKGLLMNMSINGIGFCTNEKLPVGTKIDVDLMQGEKESLPATATIVRESIAEGVYQYSYGATISVSAERVLSKYINEKQRDHLLRSSLERK